MNSIDGQIYCPSCNLEYQDDNLPRILTMCGHTFCSNCISAMMQQKQQSSSQVFVIVCPQDSSEFQLQGRDIEKFPKNRALIKMLNNKKKNSSFKDRTFDISNIVKKQQCQEDDETNELITAIVGGKSKELEENSQYNSSQSKDSFNASKQYQQPKSDKQEDKGNPEVEICLLHQKPLEIVCILDKKKICSKCAIFGQHKGHNFKGIEEVQKDVNTKYENILKVFAAKEVMFSIIQEIQQRLSNKSTEAELLQILKRKKENMKKDISRNFAKLKEAIQEQQRTCEQELDKAQKQTQAVIKNLLEVEPKSAQQFNIWEQSSYKKLKILQQSELEQKLNILYVEQQRPEDCTAIKGQQIVKKMQDQQNNLIPDVEQILINLECAYDNKIYDQIPSFLKINNFNQNDKCSSPAIPDKICGSKASIADYLKESQMNIQSQTILQGSPLLEESLLEIAQDQVISKRQIQGFNQVHRCIQENQNDFNEKQSSSSIVCQFNQLSLESAKKVSSKLPVPLVQSRLQTNPIFKPAINSSTMCQERKGLAPKNMNMTSSVINGQKPSKKKLKSIKIPPKYEKVMDGLYSNSLDILDLTNAELGDTILLQVSEFIRFSKVKTIKLIRNKLTDQGLSALLDSFSNATTLNLSQNGLTERILDTIAQNISSLPNLKNLIVSQNKIIERKHRSKIEVLKKMGLTVSV